MAIGEHDAVDCSARKNPTLIARLALQRLLLAFVGWLLYSACVCGKPGVALIADRHSAQCALCMHRVTPPHSDCDQAVVLVLVMVVNALPLARLQTRDQSTPLLRTIAKISGPVPRRCTCAKPCAG